MEEWSYSSTILDHGTRWRTVRRGGVSIEIRSKHHSNTRPERAQLSQPARKSKEIMKEVELMRKS
jgi:hypothetical protein